MALLINSLKMAQCMRVASAMMLRPATRNMAGGWNKDFKPGLFPETTEERVKAAKKYNLLPSEYRPYADDGLGNGDYPELEAGLGIEARDPYYPWDYPEHKRNHEEVLHADIDVYGEDRYSQPEQPRLTHFQYWASFLGVMGACFAIYYWLEDKKMYRPVSAKQYPGDGKVHYTFETE